MDNMEIADRKYKLTIKNTNKEMEEIEGTLLELAARYAKSNSILKFFSCLFKYEVNYSSILHFIISNDILFQINRDFRGIVEWLNDFGFLQNNVINELASLKPSSPKISPLFALFSVRSSISPIHVKFLLKLEADPNLLSEPFKLSTLNLVLLRMINEQMDDSIVDAFEYLLEYDADPNIPLNDTGYNQLFTKNEWHVYPKVPNSLYLALHLPHKYQKRVIGLLIDKVVPTQENHLGTNILEYAVKEKLYSGIIDVLQKLDAKVAQELVQKGNIISSILFNIMKQPSREIPHDLELIRHLLKFGANPNLPIKKSRYGEDLPNSLFFCIDLEEMDQNRYSRLIKMIIENNANYRAKHKDLNALHYALTHHKFKAFKNIVENVPENDECLSQGILRSSIQKTLSPLNRFLLEITQYNLGTTRLAVETVKLLLEKGANANLFVKPAKSDDDERIWPDFPNTLFLAIHLQDKIDRDIILLLIYLGNVNLTTTIITTISAFRGLNILEYIVTLSNNNEGMFELLKYLMKNVMDFNREILFKTALKKANNKVKSWLRDHNKNVMDQERLTRNRLGISTV